MTLQDMLFKRRKEFLNNNLHSPNFIIVSMNFWTTFAYLIYMEFEPYNIHPLKSFNADNYVGGSFYGMRILRTPDLGTDFILL